jgi:hypothetical protein
MISHTDWATTDWLTRYASLEACKVSAQLGRAAPFLAMRNTACRICSRMKHDLGAGALSQMQVLEGARPFGERALLDPG